MKTVAVLVPLLAVFSGCATLAPRGSGRSLDEVLHATQSIAYELDEEDRLFEDPVEAPADLDERVRPEIARLLFRWPLGNVQRTSAFGLREGRPHQGVDLMARLLTPVFAALSGVVVYAGNRISGYGDTIILRHARGVSTIYAHCSKLLVEEGERVIRGQRIALSGETGRASAPHLHFEIRDGMTALDPFVVIRP